MTLPTQNDPQFKLRLPLELKSRIEQSAEDNNRSINAEIITALEARFPAVPPGKLKSLEARVLVWMAKRIRNRNPALGSVREQQATSYEIWAAKAEASARQGEDV